MLGPSYRIVKSLCPICGHKLDGAFCTDGDHQPKPGHFGVCIKCATVLVYGDDLKVKICPVRVWGTSEAADEINRVRAAIMEMNAHADR
jgi:hypothetical protein